MAWLPCQVCYYVGDAFCRVINRLLKHEEGTRMFWLCWKLYAVYNYFMLKSLALNDWAGLDVWSSKDAHEL